MNYWERRQANEMYEAMESAEKTAKEIADIYAKASRELNYQITLVYERYRDKFDLTDAEATKLLNMLRTPGDINELKKRLEGKKGAAAQEILKELESPAYRARIERLENLQSEIDRVMKDVYKREKKISTDHYVDQINDSYYREVFDLKKRTGLDYSFSYVDEKEIDRILRTNWSGKHYSQSIWGNTQELADDLKEQMLLAYLTGKNESDIAAEIANEFAKGASYARRLVRTESAYISGQAQAAADEDAGIDSYRILATLDLRTSDKCREMDGKVFEYKDMKVGVNCPPFHPYCRTTVLSEIEDQDLSQLKRRSRDPVTGELKKFPGDITYKQWYKSEIANNSEALKKEKMMKNRAGDTALFEKYRRIFGSKKIGKNLDEFREIKYNKTEEWEKLKAEKQEAINNLSDDKIVELNGMLGYQETRLWYKHMDEKIPELVKDAGSLEEQAKKAFSLRNKYRTQARDLMKDQEQRRAFDINKPNMSWEKMLERKKEKYGLTGEEAYKDIIRSSTTTNKLYDEKAGIKP